MLALRNSQEAKEDLLMDVLEMDLRPGEWGEPCRFVSQLVPGASCSLE